MAEVMGGDMIREIGIEAFTAPTPPTFTDPNGDLTVTALNILFHTDEFPIRLGAYTEAQFRASAEPRSEEK
jgi:hypothetical protein